MKFFVFSSFLLAFSIAEKNNLSTSYTPQTPKEFPKANLNTLFQSTPSFEDTASLTFETLQSAQTAIITPTRSIDSLFLRLPSSNELQQLALSADSVGILKTIQVVATDDSLSCEQRISYLLQVLGRVRSALSKKQFAGQQLKTIIDGAQRQIQRLQKQIRLLQEKKKSLWIDEMKEKLKKILKDLRSTYFQFNFTQSQIPIKEGKIRGYERELERLRRKSDSERNRIAQDKIKLVEVRSIIKNLEIQLKEAKERQRKLEENIEKSENIISTNDKKINQARQQIQDLEKQIRQLRDNIDNLRRNYTNLQIEIERLRTDITINEAKEDKLNARIDRYKDRVKFQQSKIVQDDYDDLSDMIQGLNQLIPATSNEIDRHYYYCYGEGSVQIQKTGSVTVYIIKGERFGDYLHNVYGRNIKIPPFRKDVKFRKVDIFGSIWISFYGDPFPKQVSLKEDFSCLNPSRVVKGYGVISKIEHDYIQARNSDGRNMKFKLGTCTRLESTEDIPKVGQHFFYSAVPSFHGYQLYSGSCV